MATHPVPETHDPTPVGQLESTVAQRLVASVVESYQRHRRGRPVRALDIERMAERMCESARARSRRAGRGDIDSPAYHRAVRAQDRQRLALRRLAVALERQGAGR